MKIILVLAFILMSPLVAFAQSDCDQACGVFGDTIVFCNPLEICNFEQLLLSVLIYAQSIVVVLALIFIIVGSIFYMISAGDENTVIRGKKTITYALIGLSIAIAAPSFLNEISIILGWQEADVPGDPLTLSQILINVLYFLLSLVGTIALIMMVIGSIAYLTSAGDEDRIEKGKKIIKYSIIGIIVALSSLVIIKQIAAFFS